MVGSLPPARPLARGECGACTGCWARMHLRAPPLRGAGLPGLDQLENRRRGRLQRHYHPHASQPACELGGRLTTCQSLRRRIREAGRTIGAAASTSRSRTPLRPTFSSARSTRCLMVPGWQYRHVCSTGGKRYAPRRAASTSARSQSRAVGHSDVLRFADDLAARRCPFAQKFGTDEFIAFLVSMPSPLPGGLQHTTLAGCSRRDARSSPSPRGAGHIRETERDAAKDSGRGVLLLRGVTPELQTTTPARPQGLAATRRARGRAG